MISQNTYCHIHKPDLNDQPGIYKHEIVLIVKMNNHEAFIFKKPIKLTYYKFEQNTIIGTDGVFYNFYMKDWAGWSKDAFGGSKFTLTMHDGEEVHCEGQWWDAISPIAKMLLEGQNFTHSAANSLERLQECYVYCGYTADVDKLKELRDTYKGPVVDYYDGEFIIKSWKKSHGKLKALMKGYNGELQLIDEHDDIYQYKIIHGQLYFKYIYKAAIDGSYSEYFTEGKKDFSIDEPRKKPEYHICVRCGSDDATLDFGYDGKHEYYCHRCSKQMEHEENIRNYY